jgi:Fe-S cluster biogenesis protein NfuA
MRTWFAKVVDSDKEKTTKSETLASSEPPPPEKKSRRLVNAPPRTQNASEEGANGAIRIKAQLVPDEKRIVLMVDRAVLPGYSFWCVSSTEAAKNSPLAARLFDQIDPESVLIHDMNVTVTGVEATPESAKQLGGLVRQLIESGQPVVTPAYLAAMPSEDLVRSELQNVIDNEVNPGIAAHSGTITLTSVQGNTAYIKMGGGCQGCAASSITLRHGVEQAFRNAVPQLGALLDETDHTAGKNPFFTDLPAGMRN